jgi:hypothetical protein
MVNREIFVRRQLWDIYKDITLAFLWKDWEELESSAVSVSVRWSTSEWSASLNSRQMALLGIDTCWKHTFWYYYCLVCLTIAGFVDVNFVRVHSVLRLWNECKTLNISVPGWMYLIDVTTFWLPSDRTRNSLTWVATLSHLLSGSNEPFMDIIWCCVHHNSPLLLQTQRLCI